MKENLHVGSRNFLGCQPDKHAVYDGVVTRIFPRSREVRVRYPDHRDIARTTGEPRTRSVRVPLGDVDLSPCN